MSGELFARNLVTRTLTMLMRKTRFSFCRRVDGVCVGGAGGNFNRLEFDRRRKLVTDIIAITSSGAAESESNRRPALFGRAETGAKLEASLQRRRATLSTATARLNLPRRRLRSRRATATPLFAAIKRRRREREKKQYLPAAKCQLAP